MTPTDRDALLVYLRRGEQDHDSPHGMDECMGEVADIVEGLEPIDE